MRYGEATDASARSIGPTVSSERAGRRGRREMTCARRRLPFAIATAMASPLREVLLVGLGGVGAICEKPLNKSSVIIN